MKETLYKNFHFLVILYGLYNCYIMYNEHIEKKEALEQQAVVVETQLVKIKKKVAGIKKNEERLKEYEARVADVKAQVEQLKTKMPTEADRTSVLQELTNTAQDLNLKEVVFSPIPKTDKGMYFVNSIALTGKGTYLQFLILFEKILSNNRFFNVENFQLSESVGESKGRFIFVNVKADLQTFEYNENYKEPEVPQTPGAPRPAPENSKKDSEG